VKRVSLNVESCFPFLLRWILSWWNGKQLAFACDATTLSDRFVVLTISVLYRGCAIPVAWIILLGNKPHAWKKEWLRMLRSLKVDIPPDMVVIVLTDRGLYFKRLFKGIQRLDWHPFMRINSGGTFYPEGEGYYRPLTSFAPLA
jgi:hypothetical protein